MIFRETNVNADLLIVNLQKISKHGKRASDIVKKLQDQSTKGTAQEFFERHELDT